MSIEKKAPQWGDMPRFVLAKIFRHAICLDCPRCDRCPQCQRPYYWHITKGRTATAITGVSRRWRQIATHCTVLPAFGSNGWVCDAPYRCFSHMRNYINQQMARCHGQVRMKWLPHIVVEYGEDSDEDDSLGEYTLSDSSSEAVFTDSSSSYEP